MCEFATAFARATTDKAVGEAVPDHIDTRRIAQAVGNDMVGQELVAATEHRGRDKCVEETCMAGEQHHGAAREVAVVAPLDACANHAGNQVQQGVGIPAHVAPVQVPSPSFRSQVAEPAQYPGDEGNRQADRLDDECADHQDEQPEPGHAPAALDQVAQGRNDDQDRANHHRNDREEHGEGREDQSTRRPLVE